MSHLTRRALVRSAVAGTVLFPALVSELLAQGPADPLAPRPPHFPPGCASSSCSCPAVSHVDLFDPKSRLTQDHGKAVTLDHPETRNRPGYEKPFRRPQWSSRSPRAGPR